MPNNINNVIREINHLKRKLGDLWVLKGKTDQEVLDLAEEIDSLLNKYDYLLKHSDCAKKQNYPLIYQQINL
jgi:hypothetical protein